MTDSDTGPPSPRPRRGLAIAALGILVLALVWAGAVVVAALEARSELDAARSALLDARDRLGDAELEATTQALGRASQALETARDRLERPDVRLAAAVPGIGNSLEVAQSIAAAADDVTRSAATTVSFLEDAADGGFAGEGLPVGLLEELSPVIDSTAAATVDAVAEVRASPDTWLPGEIRDARRTFLAILGPLSEDAGRAADLVEVLPAFLGSQSPRRYFLAASNPAESRGGGGYLGAFAIATFRDGDLEIGDFEALYELPNLDEGVVAAPEPWFSDRYDRYGGTGFWQNLNMTPHFPAAATAIERLWTETGGEPLDGTIVVDPFAFEALLAVTGPVEVPGGPLLDGDNVVDFVTNRAYAEIEDDNARKAILGALAATTLERFLAEVDAGRLQDSADLLAALVADDHLLLHSADDETQQVFERLGLAGALPEVAGDFLTVITNSATASKVDYYAQRTLDYEVTLGADGRAAGSLTVTIANDSPQQGLPGRVIGPNTQDHVAGENHLLVAVYPASSATFTAFPDLPTREETEAGHPVASTWVRIPAQDSVSLEYGWLVEDAWREEDGTLVYDLTYEDQVTIRPTLLDVTVAVPDGFTLVDGPRDATVEGDAVVLRRRGTDATMRFTFAPDDEAGP